MTPIACPNLERPLSQERFRSATTYPRAELGIRTQRVSITRLVRVSAHTTVWRTRTVWVEQHHWPIIAGATVRGAGFSISA